MLILLFLKVKCSLGTMVKRAATKKAAGNPCVLIGPHLGFCAESEGHRNVRANHGESENRDQTEEA